MTGETRHSSDVLLREAASLLYLMGGMGARHLVLVGGMVPPLLVPQAAHLHIGSSDIDLCFSVAMTSGTTRQYNDSIQQLIEPFFEPASAAGHRWRKRADAPGLPLLVDFLAPAGEDTSIVADGTIQSGSALVEENLGTRLSPFGIRAGELLDQDAETLTVADVDLLYHPPTTDVDVRHSGPVGLLAAKADALFDRTDTKDGYDVAWWCLNAADQPQAVAEIVMRRPAYRHEAFAEAVHELERAFKSEDAPGPHGYAAELLPEAASGDSDYDRARAEAYVAVRGVLDVLKHHLWDHLAA